MRVPPYFEGAPCLVVRLVPVVFPASIAAVERRSAASARRTAGPQSFGAAGVFAVLALAGVRRRDRPVFLRGLAVPMPSSSPIWPLPGRPLCRWR